jgi:hypothetical protein
MSVVNLNSKSKVLRFYEANVYGNVLIYCHDSSIAEILRVLTKKKTVDHDDLEALKKLGIEVMLDKLPKNGGI